MQDTTALLRRKESCTVYINTIFKIRDMCSMLQKFLNEAYKVKHKVKENRHTDKDANFRFSNEIESRAPAERE